MGIGILPVLFGRHPVVSPENPMKVAGIVIAYGAADIGNGQTGALEKECRLIQALYL